MVQPPWRMWLHTSATCATPAPVRRASPSLQPCWNGNSWKWWRKGRLKREMGSCSKEHKSLPSSWLPLSSHLKGSVAGEATRSDGFVLTCPSPIIFWAFFLNGADPYRPSVVHLRWEQVTCFWNPFEVLRLGSSAVGWEKHVPKCGLIYKDPFIMLLFLGTVSKTVYIHSTSAEKAGIAFLQAAFDSPDQ